MNIVNGNGKLIVDVNEIGKEIANEMILSDKDEYSYSYVMESIWSSLYTVTDYIDDIIKQKLEEDGMEYIVNDAIFTRKYREKASEIIEQIEEMVKPKYCLGWSIPYKQFNVGKYTFEFTDWGSEDEMIKLCEKIEKIDGVSYCECNWDDETGDYNFWGTVEVNLGDD